MPLGLRELTLSASVLVLAPGMAWAQNPPPAGGAAEPAAPAAPAVAQPAPPAADPAAPPAEAKPKPPYSLPWQLRGVVPVTGVRSDTVFAFYKNAEDHGGFTVAEMLTGSFKVTPEFAPLIRLGVVGNSAPTGTPPAPNPGGGFSFVNPVVGAIYGFTFGEFKLTPFLGLTIPIGMGGGDTPSPGIAAATASGIYARSAMDNAMFAVNYFTIFPGVGFAYVGHGFTAQVEVTLLELIRVRGKANPASADATRTNMTFGLHLGYFFVPQFSLGAEIRGQAWLVNNTVTKVPDNPAAQQFSFAVGPRFHFKLGKSAWFRPGIAYARGIDKPMASPGKYNIVQLDLPFAF